MQYQDCKYLLERFDADNPDAGRTQNGDNHAAVAKQHPPLFSGILPADCTGICQCARVKEFARGEMLYFEGGAVERVMLLTSGSVKVSKLGRGGEEVILRLAVPGDVLGALGLFSSGTQYTTTQVFRTCRALVWEARAFEDLVKRFPVLQQNMLVILQGYLRELEERFREVATDRVGQRVALQLLRLLKTIGRATDAGVEVGLSREELAQMTGTTLFTVSRLLSAWEARGVVSPRREAVTICEIESLRAISEEA